MSGSLICVICLIFLIRLIPISHPTAA